ncbi:hypothetical protein ACWDZ4_12890 [Streptomyces sp. NPDC003016]
MASLFLSVAVLPRGRLASARQHTNFLGDFGVRAENGVGPGCPAAASGTGTFFDAALRGRRSGPGSPPCSSDVFRPVRP